MFPEHVRTEREDEQTKIYSVQTCSLELLLVCETLSFGLMS